MSTTRSVSSGLGATIAVAVALLLVVASLASAAYSGTRLRALGFAAATPLAAGAALVPRGTLAVLLAFGGWAARRRRRRRCARRRRDGQLPVGRTAPWTLIVWTRLDSYVDRCRSRHMRTCGPMTGSSHLSPTGRNPCRS